MCRRVEKQEVGYVYVLAVLLLLCCSLFPLFLEIPQYIVEPSCSGSSHRSVYIKFYLQYPCCFHSCHIAKPLRPFLFFF